MIVSFTDIFGVLALILALTETALCDVANYGGAGVLLHVAREARSIISTSAGPVPTAAIIPRSVIPLPNPAVPKPATSTSTVAPAKSPEAPEGGAPNPGQDASTPSPTSTPTTTTTTTTTSSNVDANTSVTPTPSNTSPDASSSGNAIAEATTAPTSTPTDAVSNGDGNKKSSNTGVIVGAVIGSILGTCLIIVTLFVGIRIGRKQADQNDPESGSRGFRHWLGTLPRPTISWSRPGERSARARELDATSGGVGFSKKAELPTDQPFQRTEAAELDAAGRVDPPEAHWRGPDDVPPHEMTASPALQAR